MTTAEQASTLPRPHHPARSGDGTRAIRRRLLRADGLFLTIVGAVQVAFELSAYTAGVGPFGTAFHGSPYVIGFVEAHGLACIIGVVLLTVAIHDERRFWHAFAFAVHLLLAVANVTFWSSFSFFHVVPLGIAATVAHVLFILAHVTILTATRQPAPSRR